MQDLEKFGRNRQIQRLQEEEKKESTTSEGDSEDDRELGPSSHVSLLDQHSRLKQEAQGGF